MSRYLKLGLLLATASVVLAVVGVALAQSTSSTTKLCETPSGSVRVPPCRSNEQQFSVSPGNGTFTVVDRDGNGSPETFYTVRCPNGFYASGGGYEGQSGERPTGPPTAGIPDGVSVQGSFPIKAVGTAPDFRPSFGGSPPIGWGVHIHNPDSLHVDLNVFAICSPL